MGNNVSRRALKGTMGECPTSQESGRGLPEFRPLFARRFSDLRGAFDTTTQGLQTHHSQILTRNQIKELEASMQHAGSISLDKTIGLVRFTLLRAEVTQATTSKVHATVSIGLQVREYGKVPAQ
jgi:hypothetical protein